jgi:putative Mn2+ efflux pump MntP
MDLIAKVVILAALGLDTLAIGISFGLAGINRAYWLRIGLILAMFSVLMPVIGLLAGESLSDRGAVAALYIAGFALIAAGVHGFLEARRTAYDEEAIAAAAIVEAVLHEEVIEEAKLGGGAGGFSRRDVYLTSVMGSMDKLAVGLALGAEGLRPGFALAYLAGQTFVVALGGMALGKRLGATLGERAEMAASLLLVGIGVAIVLKQVLG